MHWIFLNISKVISECDFSYISQVHASYLLFLRKSVVCFLSNPNVESI